MQAKPLLKKRLAGGIILFLFVSLVMISCIPLSHATTFNKSDEHYFENVNVLVTGRIRTVLSDGVWNVGLFIGFEPFCAVVANDSHFEGIRVTIFNESVTDPWLSLPRAINTFVEVENAEGIFFWKYLSLPFMPSIVFVVCHAEKVWIER